MKKTTDEIRTMTTDEIRTMTTDEIRICISEALNRMRELKNIMGRSVCYNEEYRNLDFVVCNLMDEEDDRCGYYDHLFDDFE